MRPFFRKSALKSVDEQTLQYPVSIDLHSHLLPGIDDGAQTIEESITLIKGLSSLGIKKAITSPHVMHDFYKNTPDIIRKCLSAVRKEISKQNLDFTIEASAEYYLDEGLYEMLMKGEELLSFGDRYLLFELSFMNEPGLLKDFIFQLHLKGFKPVLAHPERYMFFHRRVEKLEELKNAGVFFQLNLNSISGYYSVEARKMAEWLIDQQMVDFVGSDCHAEKHLIALQETLGRSKYMDKLRKLKLLNSSL
jgi:tyrosine-protein phosphatase YwqE